MRRTIFAIAVSLILFAILVVATAPWQSRSRATARAILRQSPIGLAAAETRAVARVVIEEIRRIRAPAQPI